MDKTVLEARIEQRATKLFEHDLEQALVIASQNPVLERLRIGKFKLVSAYGHCPSTDLLNKSDRTLLRKETNIEEVKAELIQKYIEKETEAVLAGIATIAEYLQATA